MESALLNRGSSQSWLSLAIELAHSFDSVLPVFEHCCRHRLSFARHSDSA